MVYWTLAMNNTIKLIALTSAILLSGCVGPQASFGEKMQDSFFFTSADNATDSEIKCIALTRPYTLPSGAVSFSLPAGKYTARKKNSTGYFYYAPQPILSSNSFFSFDQDGIYIDNQFNRGNIFGKSANGFDSRPIRGAVLPQAIFAYIKKTSC